MDTGSLADSWRFQRDQPAYAGAYAEHGDFDEPERADRAELQALLNRADASIPYHRPDRPTEYGSWPIVSEMRTWRPLFRRVFGG